MKELAEDGIAVSVSCAVLKLARQPYYRWLAQPITASELIEAYRANALFDAHRDDPQFGHRLLADEARQVGEPMCDRTAWRICQDNHWWSSFGKKRGQNSKKPGPPVHDDLCAIIDAWGNKIVGYSMNSHMTSQLAVTALNNAVAQRGDVAGCVVHTDQGDHSYE